MLVLRRKVGDRVLIGDDVELTVLGYSRGGVNLGIEAPREVRVRRAGPADGPESWPAWTDALRPELPPEPIDPEDEGPPANDGR